MQVRRGTCHGVLHTLTVTEAVTELDCFNSGKPVRTVAKLWKVFNAAHTTANQNNSRQKQRAPVKWQCQQHDADLKGHQMF